jgi:iron complex outermembrane receptor protein
MFRKKTMHERHLLLSLVLVCSPLLTPCQAETVLPSEVDFFTALPIVLSASRLAQPLSEAPAAVSVIDREMIEASGFTQIADLLRLAPGFQVGLSTVNNSTAVTYHGQADALPRRMEVLVDGHSVYSSLFSVDWHDLGVALADVDRIEVVRGSNAPTYGSNAFTATINIITRPRYADPGWFAQATLGSNATRAGTLRRAGKLGSFDYRLSLGYDQTDNFPGRNDEQRLRTLTLRGWKDLNDTDTLEIQLGARNGPIGRGGDDVLFNPLGVNIGTDHAESNRQQLRWTRVLGAGRDTSVQFYHQRHQEEDNATAGLLSDIMHVPSVVIPILFPGHSDEVISTGLFNHTDERFDLEWQLNDVSDERLQWVAGAGLRLSRVRSLVELGSNGFVQDRGGRAFADVAYRLDEGWLVNASGMLEQSDTLDLAFSYRLALNHQLRPNQTVRASVTRALRDSGLFSNNMDMGLHFSNGDPINLVGYSPGNLRPEAMLAWELGWLGNWFERRLSLDVKAFREEIRREIIGMPGSAPEPYPNGALILGNGAGVNITGLEGQLQYRPNHRDLAALQFSLANAKDRFDPASSGRASEAGRTPNLSLSLLLAHTFSNDVQLSLGYYHIDQMRWEGAGEVAAGKLPLPAYDRVDLRLAKRFRWSAQDVLVELIAQNLGNQVYAEFRADNSFDTRYFLRASVQFR